MHLTTDGAKRAKALASLFKSSDKNADPFPAPSVIFAAKDSKKSHRSVETVTPLAQALKLSVNSTFQDEEFAKLAHELLRDPATVQIGRRSSNVFSKLAELIRRKLREGRHPSCSKAAVPDHCSECTLAQRYGGSAEVWGVDTCYNLSSMTPRAVLFINRPSQFGYGLI